MTGQWSVDQGIGMITHVLDSGHCCLFYLLNGQQQEQDHLHVGHADTNQWIIQSSWQLQHLLSWQLQPYPWSEGGPLPTTSSQAVRFLTLFIVDPVLGFLQNAGEPH